MSVSGKCQINERPTGWKYPLPARKWSAYGALVGDASGSSKTLYIPRPYDYGAASVEAFTILSTTTPNATTLRVYTGAISGGSADFLVYAYLLSDLVVGSLRAFRPSNPVNQEILHQIISFTDIKNFNLDYFFNVIEANADAQTLYIYGLGYYWDAVKPPETQEPFHPMWGLPPPSR